MKKSKLGSRIVSWFRNVRLGYKLAIVYALSGFLPVVAVLSVTYVQMKQILLQNERDSMESYLYQALASMENKLAIYTNLNNYICYNQTISQVIGYQYDSVYEMYNQLVTILDPMLASLKYFHNDVGKVTIYVDKDMIKHGDTLAPISEIIDTNWYRSVADSGEMQWFVDKNEEIVFGVSPMSMLKRYGLDGILYISVEYDSMFETFKQTLQINTLIKEVYEGRIKEKEYEMRALQAQINPHFLYNTLSLINWKAIEADAKDISKITLALSTFYRTSLNKGKNVMSLSDELRNMRSYLDIQLMMHDYEFDVEFDVDESIGQYQSLNLMLQPLIENAIAHGIDVKTDGRGKLTITGKEDGDLIVLTVADNGVGMSDEQAARILTEESKGYGVRNVNERIKLYYGEQYSLQIESKIGQGTKASIRIPKRIS